MMLSALLALLAYGAVAVVTARGAYGVQRARMIEQEGRDHLAEDPVRRFRETGQEAAATAALVYGLAWPVVVPVFLVSRGVVLLVTARPRTTGYERELRRAAVRRRTAELERALGFDDRLDDRAAGRSG